ncbi:MAG: hypothetical protein AB7T19_05620 [Planctomycetota bacterium]
MQVGTRLVSCVAAALVGCVPALGQCLVRVATPVMVRASDREPVAAATVTLLGRTALFGARSEVVDRVQGSTDGRGRIVAELRDGIHYVGWAESRTTDGRVVVSPLKTVLIPGVATIFELDPELTLSPRRVVIRERKGWSDSIAARLSIDAEQSPLVIDLEPGASGEFPLPTLPRTALRVQIQERNGFGTRSFLRGEQAPFADTWSCDLPRLAPVSLEVRGGPADLPIAHSRIGLIESGVWREIDVTADTGAISARFTTDGSIERVFSVGPDAIGAGPSVRSADGRRLVTRTRAADLVRVRLMLGERPFPSAKAMIRQHGIHVQTATSQAIAQPWREIRPDDAGVLRIEGVHTHQPNPTFLELTDAGLATLPRALAPLWPIIPDTPGISRSRSRPEDPPVDVDLERMVAVEWLVRLADGTPAVGARIAIVAFTDQKNAVVPSRVLPIAIAGREGSLRMLLPPHGDYALAVVHDSGGKLLGVHTGIGGLDAVHSFPITLEPAITVVGKVLDRAGSTVSGAMVFCSPTFDREDAAVEDPTSIDFDAPLSDTTRRLPAIARHAILDHAAPVPRRTNEKGEFTVRFPFRGGGWTLSAGGEPLAIGVAALGKEPVELRTAK